MEENTRAGESVGDAVAAEDPDDDGLTYSLSGTDAAAFTIDENTGQMRTKEALDFETKPSYTFTIEVHDGLDALGNTSTIIDDTQDVDDHCRERGGAGDRHAHDGQRDNPGSRAGDGDARGRRPAHQRHRHVAVVSLAGRQQGLGGHRGGNERQVHADVGGGLPKTTFARRRRTGTGTAPPTRRPMQCRRRVGDAPPVNSAPVFPTTETGQREVAEDASGSANIGAPVVATDLNAGDSTVNDPLEYSLSGTDAEFFTIDSGTGQLRLAQGVTLDYEGKRSYRVTVEVTDGANDLGDNDPAGNPVIDARKNVTITLTDVNEAPVVSGEASVSVDENLKPRGRDLLGCRPGAGHADVVCDG